MEGTNGDSKGQHSPRAERHWPLERKPTAVGKSHAALAATSLAVASIGQRTVHKWRMDLPCWIAKILQEDGGMPTNDANEKD